MSRAPALERDQAPEEIRALYDMVEKRPGVPVEQLELALTVAAAQFSNRVNAALELDLEHP